MDKPTIEEICDAWRDDTDKFETVIDELDGTWRHGTEHTLVVERLSDNTFWRVFYRHETSGEYNDLRDGDLSDSDIVQVKPIEVVTKKIEYVPIEAVT